MKKSIQVSIPAPCHEKWSSFQTTARGGFCSSCEKEVIDFTSWSEDRLKLHFKNLPANSCGRFRNEQLKVYTYEQPRPTALRWVPAFVIGSLLALTSKHAVAQSAVKSIHNTEQIQSDEKSGKVLLKSSSLKVTGEVQSTEDSMGLPGVNVVRKGTSEGTVTNEKGQFELNIENADSTEILVFSFIGLKTTEYPINRSSESIVVSLAYDEIRLGGMVTVGGIVATRKISPRRWWWKIKSWF